MRIFRSARTMLAIALWLSPPAAFPGQDAAPRRDFPKGEIIDKVVCESDVEQSYALYLPSAYDQGRTWPIIYCFDPRANGKNPVLCFREAAEAFGYILAGSNNSKNGPWEPTGKALAAMLDDTRSRFSLDGARIYAAGFSGGAQAALLIPLVLRNPAVAGIIACCNGLPPGIALANYPKEVSVLAATGLNDFNYWPTRKVGPELGGAGIANRLLVFPGEHQWPPSEAARQALAWLELQAMKTGRRKPDEAWIRERYAEDLERARKAESAGRTVDAFLAYSDLAADYRSLCDVTEAEGAKRRLQGSSEVRKYPEAARAAEEAESRQAQELGQMINAILQSPNSQQRRQAERRLRDSLPSSKGEPAEMPEIAVNPRRPLYLAYAQIMNEASRELGKDPKGAVPYYEIATILKPEGTIAWYNLTCLYNDDGETKKALAALEKALADGRIDPETIEKDPDFAPLRKEAAYARIIEDARRRRNTAKK